MTDRPTPEQLVQELDDEGGFASDLMDMLGRHGYVIVHPDDMPELFEACVECGGIWHKMHNGHTILCEHCDHGFVPYTWEATDD